MTGPSLLQRLLAACVTILVAMLALQWATSILQQIWPTLAIAAAVVLIAAGVIALIRWHRSRW